MACMDFAELEVLTELASGLPSSMPTQLDVIKTSLDYMLKVKLTWPRED